MYKVIIEMLHFLPIKLDFLFDNLISATFVTKREGKIGAVTVKVTV